MQMSEINGSAVSRFGLGTKRFPTEDSSRVVHLDAEATGAIFDACVARGVDFFETSYSNHKGEAESFLGDYIASSPEPLRVCTSYFEMVDPRFEYVFQKQMKKLQTECIDFYFIEGVTDMNKEVNVDSGAIDFLFECKEQGMIANLGFSSELDCQNLQEFIGRYPWDFVRLRINYYDWFVNGLDERYAVIQETGLPIIAHGALRCGPSNRIKDEALAILKEADPSRSSVDWALRFVKSLPGVKVLTTNVYSIQQAEEDMDVFCDDEVLSDGQFEVLRQAADAQRPRRV